MELSMSQINFTWSILAVIKDTYKDGYYDVIKEIQYRCTADKVGESISLDFACDIPLDLNTEFVSFNNLSDEQLLNWCWQKKSPKETIEEKISRMFIT